MQCMCVRILLERLRGRYANYNSITLYGYAATVSIDRLKCTNETNYLASETKFIERTLSVITEPLCVYTDETRHYNR